MVASLEADLDTKLFVVHTLGPDVARDLETRGLDPFTCAVGLRRFHADPGEVAGRVARLLEGYLASRFHEAHADERIPSGVGKLVVRLRQDRAVLSAHVDICRALGALRNAADHAVDRDTSRPWALTSEAALAAVLLALVSIRSLCGFAASQQQVL